VTRKILESCPSCGGPLEITELRCTRCETQVRARYVPCPFCSLSEEQSTFLRIFVTSRGNLSEVEKRLGVSYPTVRAKLDEVIEQLGASASPARPNRAEPRREPIPPVPALPAIAADPPAPIRVPEPGPSAGAAERSPRRAVLDAVQRGEISPVEAAARLRGRGGAREERNRDAPKV
jgi:hypothetical protein